MIWKLACAIPGRSFRCPPSFLTNRDACPLVSPLNRMEWLSSIPERPSVTEITERRDENQQRIFRGPPGRRENPALSCRMVFEVSAPWLFRRVLWSRSGWQNRARRAAFQIPFAERTTGGQRVNNAAKGCARGIRTSSHRKPPAKSPFNSLTIACEARALTRFFSTVTNEFFFSPPSSRGRFGPHFRRPALQLHQPIRWFRKDRELR